MAQTITIDGVSRHSVIRRETISIQQCAYLGEVGSGSFTLDDDAGSISAVGHKTVVIEQSSSTPSRLVTGFVDNKTMTRNEGSHLGITSTARFIEVATKDSNDLLTRRVFTGTGAANGNRPSETVSARIDWLLGTSYVVFADEGNVAASSVVMDANNYGGSNPKTVLEACATAAQFNFYIRWNASAAGFEIVFRDDNTSTDDECTLSISNVTSEINSTTVFALEGASLQVTPEHVYSGAVTNHANGYVYDEEPDTATAFVDRDGITDDRGIKNDDTAHDRNVDFLQQSATEEHLLSGTINLRAADVGLVQPGMRISVKQTHLATEGYGEGRWCRILRARLTQPLNTDFNYALALDLSPQEEFEPANPCEDGDYPLTASDTYYPLGELTPVGPKPNASDGIFLYWRSGYEVPGTEPILGRTDHGWHFANYGAGGVGTIDYAGDCSGNRLYIRVVGNGTAVIQTNIYAGATRPLYVNVNGVDGDSGPSGTAFEVEIDDRTEDDCVSIIFIAEATCVGGGKWGFSEMEWTAA